MTPVSSLPGRLRRLGALTLSGALLLSCDNGPSGPGGPASEFVLEVRWMSPAPTGDTLASFESAFNIVRQTIVGALPPATIPADFTSVSQCGSNFSTEVPQETVPGMIVYIGFFQDDGVGGQLAFAGPCLVRSATQRYLTVLGTANFDLDDVASLQGNGRLTGVVLHELLHVLGLGTIWADNALIEGTGTADARFLGSRARLACLNLHAGGTPCASSVPVHSTGGTGSAYAHWRESVFTSELMTPILNTGPSPFSMMTIESLGDLGYSVSGALAQPFTVSGTGLRAEVMGEGVAPLQFTDPLLPVFTLDEKGALKPVRRAQ